MSVPTDLSQQIADAAAGPQSVSSDGLMVVSQDPTKAIAADRYLAAKHGARTARFFGVRMCKLIPPGQVGTGRLDTSTQSMV